MKKKILKKLSLKKESISNLSDSEKRKLKGGTGFDTCECNTDKKESCSIFYPCCPLPEKLMDKG